MENPEHWPKESLRWRHGIGVEISTSYTITLIRHCLYIDFYSAHLLTTLLELFK